ncbi:exosortase-associated protein EpsI, B-type [Paludibacterium paludis]|uniref:Methanolan biosynthesis EpsI domain-containing protein n=1 Tax=Paludibacterium paludis TaxID=1225769 RepID=A0A918P2Z1_9NEIS|nr:exosortase-associated protein EpsI, B-type [Paludibacterium paludis]GGY15654.1 hypothetical protein GCM10011289_18720 [Paludibacterium paludis]
MAIDKRSWLPALVLAAAAAAAVALTPRQVMAQANPIKLVKVFPESFGDWKTDTSLAPVEIDPSLQALLNTVYNDTLSRTYINSSGQRIMLSVAYGGDQSSDSTQVHRPEFCYVGQGFTISAPSDSRFNLPDRSVSLRNMVARQGPRNEPISYWVTVGETSTLPGLGRKLAQLEYGLTGKVPDGMLVRVSSIDEDNGHAIQVQKQFITDMYQAIAPVYRNRVFGANKQEQ